MEPYSLHLAGVLLTFVLRVAAGFVFCLALAHLLPGSRHRFLTWLAFLLAAGFCWLELLVEEAAAFLGRGAAIAEAVGQSTGEHLRIPAAWASWISGAIVAMVAIYVVIMAALLARHLYKHLRLHLWLRRARRPSAQLMETFHSLCREFNIRRCRLMILPKTSSPATVYWWTPLIIVPEVCEQFRNTEQLKNALRHELVHTLRCDYLWSTLSDVLCALLFFHPAVWQARKRLVIERELACDLGVVETQPEHRADYAESLAHFMRLLLARRTASLGVDFAASASMLGTRIRCILTEPLQVPRWKQASCDAGIIAFVLIFVSISPALSVSFNLSHDTDLTRATALPSHVHSSRSMQPVHIRRSGVRALLRQTSAYQEEMSEPQ